MSKLQNCGQSLHRFSKRWSEFKILKKIAKLWLHFLKVWLPLNVTNGSLTMPHFLKADQNLVNFLRIWNEQKGKTEFQILRKVAF